MNLVLRQLLSSRNINKCKYVMFNNVAQRLKYDIRPVITSQNNNVTKLQMRAYSTGRQFEDKKKLAGLMQFRPIIFPSFFKYVQNWIYANFIIRPHFDPEFDLQEFIEASKHAVQVISESLNQADFDSLKGLVVDEAITELKSVVSKLSVTQRELLAINKDDIFYAFPYQVGVMFDDNDKRWVEITMCYHVLQGMKAMKEAGTLPPISIGLQPEFQDKVYILNYRFIREYTKGVEDSWWINIVNHFQPHDFR